MRCRAGVVLLALLTAGTLALPGCTTGAAPPARSHPAPAPPGLAPALAPYYAQTLTWGPCAPLAATDEQRETYADPSLECTRLRVPVDYAHPGTGRDAAIAVLRHRASSTADRIGSLVVNPGGPGGSGLDAAAGLAPTVATTPVGARFDLVGFDPRGVGASTPTVRCLTGPEQDAQRREDQADPSPQGVARADATARATAENCTRRTGADLLASVGTRDVARDLDVLRGALGDARLNYLGYSYGTRIGSTYAEQFPAAVRAMVLDGALDPDADPTEEVVAQARGFEGAFEAFARDCTTRPDCPLGRDPAQAIPRYQALVRPLLARPLPLPDGRVLANADALQGTYQALYSPQLWDPLRRALGGLGAGRGGAMMALADQYFDRAPDGTYSPEQDAFNAVRCVDDPRLTDPARAADRSRRYDEAAPFAASGRPPSASLDECAFWPAPPTGAPHVPRVPGLAPPLVVSTTGDPATPYRAGVTLARGLGGALLTKVGTQHTASFQGSACVDAAVSRYLISGAPPPPGTTCPAG